MTVTARRWLIIMSTVQDEPGRKRNGRGTRKATKPGGADRCGQHTSPSVIEYLFAEIAKYGMASVKRIYGDWTSPYLKGWKEVLLTYAIHPSSSSTTP